MSLLSADIEYESDPLLTVLKQLIGDPFRRIPPAEVALLTDYQIAECFCRNHEARGRRQRRGDVREEGPDPAAEIGGEFDSDSDAEAFVDGRPAEGEELIRAMVGMGLVKPEDAERTIAARKMAWRAEQEKLGERKR